MVTPKGKTTYLRTNEGSLLAEIFGTTPAAVNCVEYYFVANCQQFAQPGFQTKHRKATKWAGDAQRKAGLWFAVIAEGTAGTCHIAAATTLNMQPGPGSYLGYTPWDYRWPLNFSCWGSTRCQTCFGSRACFLPGSFAQSRAHQIPIGNLTLTEWLTHSLGRNKCNPSAKFATS